MKNKISVQTKQITEIYSDLTEESWYLDAVKYVHENGIMTGSNRMFKPCQTITSAQMVTILYRMAGSPDVTDYSACDVFTDVEKDAWYTNADKVNSYAEDAMKWAVAEGLLNGSRKIDAAGNVIYDLNPGGTATRAQIASILQRFCEVYDI